MLRMWRIHNVGHNMKNILYKYRDWNNEYHKSVLTKNQLFLAPPSSFNDPFDCRIFAQFVDLSPDELEEYANNLTEKANLTAIERQYAIDKIKKDPNLHQKEFERISTKNYDTHLGVISMSTKWDNILMWSHYGNMHKGFCIGLDEDNLTKEIKFGATGLVKYPKNKEYPKISPITDGSTDSFFKTVYNKSIDWEYENEYRLTNIKREGWLSNEDRIIEFSDHSISEVILGLNASEKTQDDILSICKQKNIPLFRAVKKQFHFELKKEQIKN